MTKIPSPVGTSPNVPDDLVADTQVRKEFGGISSMSLWRWDRDPKLGFPKKYQIRKRNFRSRKEIEAFKRTVLEQAIGQPRKSLKREEA